MLHEGKFDVLSAHSDQNNTADSTTKQIRQTLAVEPIKLCNGIPWDNIAVRSMECIEANFTSASPNHNLSMMCDVAMKEIHERAVKRFKRLDEAAHYILDKNNNEFLNIAPKPSVHDLSIATFGDIGFHYIPYLHSLMLQNQCIRVLVLQRNKSDTVASFGRWFGPPFHHFPWADETTRKNWRRKMIPNSKRWYDDHPQYDRCYQSFKWSQSPSKVAFSQDANFFNRDDNVTNYVPSIESGALLHYDRVYSHANFLVHYWGLNRIRIVDSYLALNDPSTSREILNFLLGDDDGDKDEGNIYVLPSVSNNTMELFHPTNSMRTASIIQKIQGQLQHSNRQSNFSKKLTVIVPSCEGMKSCCTVFDFYEHHTKNDMVSHSLSRNCTSIGLESLANLHILSDTKTRTHTGIDHGSKLNDDMFSKGLLDHRIQIEKLQKMTFLDFLTHVIWAADVRSAMKLMNPVHQ